MKRLIVSLSVFISLLVLSGSGGLVMAEEQTNCVTVSQYGGASQIVCGAKHEPKDTGLADINPLFLASGFFVLAGFAFSQYRKIQRSEVGL